MSACHIINIYDTAVQLIVRHDALITYLVFPAWEPDCMVESVHLRLWQVQVYNTTLARTTANCRKPHLEQPPSSHHRADLLRPAVWGPVHPGGSDQHPGR